jgi:O-antigen/teichoic acid export membrane protein
MSPIATPPARAARSTTTSAAPMIDDADSPSPGDGAHARTSRRAKRIKLTVLTGLIARGSSMLMTIVSVPLTLNYLGTERFGLWMTVTSVISMLTFADFGIGNGLLTVVAEASGRDDQLAIQRYVSSAFAILTVIACGILAVFFLGIYPVVDWAHAFNVHSPMARADAGPAIAALVACVAFSVSTLIVPRVQLGLQHGFISNLSVTLGLIASIGAIWLVSVERGSVALLVIAMSGTPVVANSINGLIFFRRYRQYRPSWSMVSKAAMKRILDTGLMFVLLQLGLAISYASDKLIIARLLGAEAVASYSVYERVFGVGTNLMLVMLMPIWPAYAEAWARRDTGWVRKALRRSLTISVGVSMLFAALITIFGPLIVSVWTRKNVPVQPIVLYGLAAWCIVQCTSNALSMLLNGLHKIRIQVVATTLTACVAIPLKFFLVRDVGPAGGVLASSIVATCFSIVPFSIVVWKLTRPGEHGDAVA